MLGQPDTGADGVAMAARASSERVAWAVPEAESMVRRPASQLSTSPARETKTRGNALEDLGCATSSKNCAASKTAKVLYFVFILSFLLIFTFGFLYTKIFQPFSL